MVTSDGRPAAAGEAASSGLEVTGLTVRFGATVAVADASLAVAPGEIVALIGPSGCGKSTLLRAVAGLEVADGGRVRWDGTDLATTPPHRRGFGLMFQDHALFPHRRVDDNVAFGLRMQGLPSAEQRRRVAEVLHLVGLDGYGERTIDTLSGGEAQRVALARALAPAPRLLMLDEPLGSLDRTLRDRLAADLRGVLREAKLAAIHVTHDQEEAYAVADRLVVMRAGAIVRDGPAAEVWHDPRSAFVARFLGHHNVVDAATAAALGVGDGQRSMVLREAAIRLDPTGPLATTVSDVRFRGATSRVTLRVELDGRPPVELSYHTARPPALGTRQRLRLDADEVATLA